MKGNIKEVADNLIECLLDYGFVVQRYDALSTDSVYLKLDYGVANSIRISNHKGKSYLKYRFNVRTDIPKRAVLYKDNLPMYYFPLKDVNCALEMILHEKKEKINKYGIDSYRTFMNKNKEDNKERLGFWQHAVTLERG